MVIPTRCSVLHRTSVDKLWHWQSETNTVHMAGSVMASKRESQLSKISLAFNKPLTRIVSSEYALQKYCLRNSTASRTTDSISLDGMISVTTHKIPKPIRTHSAILVRMFICRRRITNMGIPAQTKSVKASSPKVTVKHASSNLGNRTDQNQYNQQGRLHGKRSIDREGMDSISSP